MKEYKSNEELIEYLKNKGVTIYNKKKVLDIIDNYSYYSVVNTYKFVFKNDEDNVTFEEIYALYEFDKNIRAIFLKYILEIETLIRSLIAELISSKYGLQNYLI